VNKVLGKNYHSFGHAIIMKKCEQSIKVYIFVYKAWSKSWVVIVFLLIHWSNMAKNELVTLTRVSAITVWNHRMHTKLCMLSLFNKMSSHCRSHYICYIRMLFWKIRRKIHFFPSIFLFYELHARKTEVLSYPFSFYEIY